MNQSRLPGLGKRGSRLWKASCKRHPASKGFSAIKLTAVVLIALLLLVGAVAGAIQYKKRVWKRGGRISFVVQSKNDSPDSEVHLVTLLSQRKAMHVISFPSEMRVNAVGSYGLWRLSSLYSLGEIEGKSGSILRKSVSEFMGADVAGYIVYADEEVEISQDSLRSKLKRIVIKTMLGESETNFSLYDLIRIFRSISLVPAGETDLIGLEESGVLEQEIQPDGAVVFTADSQFLDRLVKRLFSYQEIVEEEIAIAVVNATEHRGLGAGVGRIVRNIGGDLISVSDYEQKLGGSRFIVSEEGLENSFTVVKLAEIFIPQKIEAGPILEHRADLLMVVGEDYWERLNKP